MRSALSVDILRNTHPNPSQPYRLERLSLLNVITSFAPFPHLLFKPVIVSFPYPVSPPRHFFVSHHPHTLCSARASNSSTPPGVFLLLHSSPSPVFVDYKPILVSSCRLLFSISKPEFWFQLGITSSDFNSCN